MKAGAKAGTKAGTKAGMVSKVKNMFNNIIHTQIKQNQKQIQNIVRPLLKQEFEKYNKKHPLNLKHKNKTEQIEAMKEHLTQSSLNALKIIPKQAGQEIYTKVIHPEIALKLATMKKYIKEIYTKY